MLIKYGTFLADKYKLYNLLKQCLIYFSDECELLGGNDNYSLQFDLIRQSDSRPQ